MARFLDNPQIIEESKKENRYVDVKVSIDWFNDGVFEEIESADDEFLKLDLDRTLEGDIGTSIMDRGTLVLDNSNNDYSPKSIASRFNVDMGSYYEFNLIPNRTIVVEVAINGSDYVPYYMGIISNIDSNYDNSVVSIDVEDEMITLQAESARDYMFIEQPAKEVIRVLLEDSAIDYNENLIDDMPYLINYNFEGETIYQALRKIAEMAWAKFFVMDGELHFINLQSLDETSTSVIDTINDEDFLNSGYNEVYGAEDLYTRATITANPYKLRDREIIWSGAESRANVSENYLGSDIVNNELQLTYTNEEGNEVNTNNVPIITGSLVVSFGSNNYTVGYGLSAINYVTGKITFSNTTEYPLPDPAQNLNVNYSYYLLALPPAQNGEPYEKEIIAHHEYSAIDISNPNDYVEFEAVDTNKAYETGSYMTSFNDLEHDDNGGNGDVVKWTNKITLNSNAINARIAGKFDHSAYDYRFCVLACFGGKRAHPSSKVELYVNGEFHSIIYETTKFGWSSFNKKITAGVTGGDEIQLKLTLNRNCDKSSGIQIKDVNVSVGTVSVDQEIGTVGRVEIEPIYINENRTKLIFRNYGDSEVVMYCTYKGKKMDNIYLTGLPIKQDSPIEETFVDEDAMEVFSLSGSELSITNDLIYDVSRANRTAQFLVDYYSTPRSVISIPIKGRPHYSLLDKLQIVRDEANIDNEFLINEISDSFTEDGEWNQTLTLRQARKSVWSYTDTGGSNVIGVDSEINFPISDTPNPVTNLSLSLISLEGGNSGYPAIEINYTGNRNTEYYNIYVRRGVEGSWEFVERTQEESYIFSDLYNREEYFIKVVGVSGDGISSGFTASPIESISYFGTGIITPTDISAREILREVQEGDYVSFIEITVNPNLGSFVEELEIYYKHEDDTEWTLDGKTDRLFYEILASRLGYYELRVIAKDIRGNKPSLLDTESVVIQVDGKTSKPSKVQLDEIYWGKDYIEIVWKPHLDSDFNSYEVRLDNNFGSDS